MRCSGKALCTTRSEIKGGLVSRDACIYLRVDDIRYENVPPTILIGYNNHSAYLGWSGAFFCGGIGPRQSQPAAFDFDLRQR